MTLIQLLFLFILIIHLQHGRYLLIETKDNTESNVSSITEMENNILKDQDNPVTHEIDALISNRKLKYIHKKKPNLKKSKKVKNAGKKHYLLKDDELEKLNRGLLNSLCTILIPIPLFYDTLV